jgi:hypothetical protein
MRANIKIASGVAIPVGNKYSAQKEAVRKPILAHVIDTPHPLVHGFRQDHRSKSQVGFRAVFAL